MCSTEESSVELESRWRENISVMTFSAGQRGKGQRAHEFLRRFLSSRPARGSSASCSQQQSSSGSAAMWPSLQQYFMFSRYGYEIGDP